MINIPNNLFIAVDFIILAIYLVKIIFAIKNGFIYELVSLACVGVSIWAAWFVSPILADKLSLISLDMFDNPLVDLTKIRLMVNTITWFVILFILFSIIFMIIKPLFKVFTKVPVIGPVNRIMGTLMGIIEATIITLMLSIILSTPLFANGTEVKKGTSLNYISAVTNKVSEVAYKSVIENVLKNTDTDVDSQRELLENWLIEQGIFHE